MTRFQNDAVSNKSHVVSNYSDAVSNIGQVVNNSSDAVGFKSTYISIYIFL